MKRWPTVPVAPKTPTLIGPDSMDWRGYFERSGLGEKSESVEENGAAAIVDVQS
jgi:hypothetical protein